MPDLMLTSQYPLSKLELDFGEVAVTEQLSRAIISIATPYGSGEKLSKAVASSLKTTIPAIGKTCLLYTSPSPRDGLLSRMPSSA